MNSTIPRDLAALIARIGLGVIFIAHGWQKVHTNGIDATKMGFTAMGVPMPGASAYYAGYVELVGGGLLILGLLTPIVGLLLFADMVGAFAIVHWDKGVFAQDGGYELVVALGVASLLLAAVGAGKFSIDGAFGGRVRTSRRSKVSA